jgi:hypothetical protein
MVRVVVAVVDGSDSELLPLLLLLLLFLHAASANCRLPIWMKQ